MYYYRPNPYISQLPPFFSPPRPRIIVDSGTALKNKTGKFRIRFSRTFPRPPVVIISPYWKGQESQVGFVETINSVSRNGFTVVSRNAANNYYINWVAVLQT